MKQIIRVENNQAMFRVFIILQFLYADAVFITIQKMGVYQWRTNENGYSIGVPLDTPCKKDTYVDIQLLIDLEESGFSQTFEIDVSTDSHYTTAEIAYMYGACKLVHKFNLDNSTPFYLDEVVEPYGFTNKNTNSITINNKSNTLVFVLIIAALLIIAFIVNLYYCKKSQ